MHSLKGLLFQRRSGKVRFVLLLICIFIGALLLGLLGVHAHQDPTEMDTVAYLTSALQIHETGGVLRFIPNCFSGVYKEATQHPLYLLLLSLFASNDISFFIAAKLLTLAVGLLFLVVLYMTTRRIFGKTEALVTTLFFVVNATFLRLTTMVAVESVFTLFMLLFWYSASRGFVKHKYWLYAGGFAACAFLSKSLAILTLPIFVVSVMIGKRRVFISILKSRYFAGFFLIFFIVASPLFIRNIKVYGTALYSNSSEVLWLDNWHDYGRSRPDGRTPSLSTYLEDHRPSEVLRTFVVGFVARNGRMVSDGLKPFGFWQKFDLDTLTGFQKRTIHFEEGWAVLVMLLFFVGVYRTRREYHSIVSITSLLIFFAFVGWYSKVFGNTLPTRLLYPVLFIIVAYASSGLTHLMSLFKKESLDLAWRQRIVPLFTATLTGFLLLNLCFQFNWRELNIAQSYKFSPIFIAQLKWLNTHAQQGEAVLVGQIFAASMFYFKNRIKPTVLEWPKRNTMKEVEEFVGREKIRFGILDLATVVNNTKPFSEYFEVFQHGASKRVGFRARKKLPALWRIIARVPDDIPLFEIYDFQVNTK